MREGVLTYEATDTDDAGLGKLRIPDLIVTAREAMLTDGPLDAREIHLGLTPH